MCSLPSLGEFRADLHCHSLYSDGDRTPFELIDLAVQAGLSALSITDHDTVAAYGDGVFSYAREKGIFLGTGVEFSCVHQKKSVHILGYNFSLQDESLQAYCQRQQQRRVLRNREIIDRLRRLRILIEEEDLVQVHPHFSTVGRPHIAAVMVKKRYVRSIQEAFQLYLGDGRCCFVQGEIFSVEEALSIVKGAKGKVFLAHPHLYGDLKFVRQVLGLGLEGIECYYGQGKSCQSSMWIALAREKGLLISGGSDFHGESKPFLRLGASYVEKEVFATIFEGA